jgi:hypothetical protein
MPEIIYGTALSSASKLRGEQEQDGLHRGCFVIGAVERSPLGVLNSPRSRAESFGLLSWHVLLSLERTKRLALALFLAVSAIQDRSLWRSPVGDHSDCQAKGGRPPTKPRRRRVRKCETAPEAVGFSYIFAGRGAA